LTSASQKTCHVCRITPQAGGTQSILTGIIETHLAFDLGAESGRAFLGSLHDGILDIREIHRFANEPVEYGGTMHWDAPRLWLEMRRALELADVPRLAGIGVDTWGVDYALLGQRGELLLNPFNARDPRNVSAMDEVLRRLPRADIYRATGIQLLAINTLYQLYAAQRDNPRILAAAEKLIMMPDLFHYWMTGNAVCEYTEASTTQFMNPVTRTWAVDLLEELGLSSRLPAEIVEPGSVVGRLLPGISRNTSLNGTPVIAPGSHDTASAVAAVSACGNTAFISSGTWSLVGTELPAPIVTEAAMRFNFTNEGGVCGTTRLLKNVTGMWLLQGCRRAWAAAGHDYSYVQLTEAAAKAPAFRSLVNPDSELFVRPGDMTAAIDEFCRRTDQPRPDSPGAYTRTILESLALKYRVILRDMASLTGQRIERIRVIGGGSKSRLLNQFTADATATKVWAGPAEAAVLGNIGVQLMATGSAGSLEEMRAIVERSFPVDVYEPLDPDPWDRTLVRFEHL
jgi:rhamnulokinase